ncbi:DNA polymerase IV [Candidatus Roizmanbacteria bacterium]|nr:DNA polymerase IV [Candidatus Roizmanbacteria bacterium]
MRQVILHIDFDSFFASVEQQDNLLFRNRPIGVTASNGRTCIIAASREAKKMGIKSPSRTTDVKKICHSIIFVPAHFVRYWEVSQKFIKICDEFSPTVEIFSIDEVFMDVTLTAKLFGGVDGLILQLKKRLRKEIGEYITASVGVSHNKLLAKLASGLNKPNGSFKITPDNLAVVYKIAKLTDICGIGSRIGQRLNNLGIYRLSQLQKVPLASLISEFGQVEGQFLQRVGLGLDNSKVIPYAEKLDVKSVGRQYCLPYNEYDKRKILQNIYELCEEVALKLRRLGKKARTVGIYLGGIESIYGRQTTSKYFDSGRDLFELCLLIMGTKLNGYVRRISVGVSNLVSEDTIPAPLFLREQKEEKINKIIDSINEKFGDHTIRNGFLLYADKLTTVPNGYAASVSHEFGRK